MSDKQQKRHDGFVSDDEFLYVKDAISRDQFKDLVYDLMAREPDLAIAVAMRIERFKTILKGFSLTDEQRLMLDRKITLLVWVPLLALTRAHRRAWEDFLPAMDSDDDDEATAPQEAP
jgi:hypothetical protein